MTQVDDIAVELKEDVRGTWTHLQSQTLTAQSLPPVANLLTGPLCPVPTTPPGATAGAQLTLFTPIPCAGNIFSSQLLSLNSSTLTLPSLLAHASRQPVSCGDQATRLTDAVCEAKA